MWLCVNVVCGSGWFIRSEWLGVGGVGKLRGRARSGLA